MVRKSEYSRMKKLRILFALSLLFSITAAGLAQPRREYITGRTTETPVVPPNSANVRVDILILGTIVTMNASHDIIEDGAITITGDHIDVMGTRKIVTQNVIAKRTIDARGKVIIPGLINTHTHVPMSLFRGI